MSDTPSKCPTCGMSVPQGAARCPQCGRVFGEVNRCPHCHAIAAVRRSGSTYRCVACGKERDVQPGTTVLEDGRATRLDETRGAGVRPASDPLAGLMRFAGVMLVTAAIIAGAAAAAPGAPIILLLIAAAALGIGGVTAMSGAARTESSARARHTRDLEQKVLALASARAGDLLATDVAKSLRIGLAEADALLTTMADGTRVTVEVDGDGLVHYVFRELATKGPNVRVDPSLSEADAIEVEARERVEKELRNRERI